MILSAGLFYARRGRRNPAAAGFFRFTEKTELFQKNNFEGVIR
jgi:hypothetical protein